MFCFHIAGKTRSILHLVLNTRVVLLKPCQSKHCSSNLALTWFKHNLFLVVVGDGERPQFSGGVVLAINRIGHRKDQQSHCHTGQWYGYKLMYNVSHLYYKHGQSQRYLFISVTEYHTYSRFSLWQRLITRRIKNDIVKIRFFLLTLVMIYDRRIWVNY